jgi:predicted amidohydrolase
MLAFRAVLRVTVVEMPASWGEPEHALRLADAALAAGPPSDLVLLPEACLTGYVSPELDFDLSRFAESVDGPTARALAELARRRRTHVVGPLVLEEDGARFNATVAFDPDGRRTFLYKKRHPWIPERWATPGPDPHPLVRIGGVAVTVACCFDVHFVAHEAGATLDAADLLLFPSAWVEEGEDTRLARLAAIARAHDVAVAAANWGPGVVHVPGQGGSAILDARGEVLARVRGGAMRADAVVRR